MTEQEFFKIWQKCKHECIDVGDDGFPICEQDVAIRLMELYLDCIEDKIHFPTDLGPGSTIKEGAWLQKKEELGVYKSLRIVYNRTQRSEVSMGIIWIGLFVAWFLGVLSGILIASHEDEDKGKMA